jgi:hypothetical protein
LGDNAFECGEVDLAEGALVDVGADPKSVGLLVVRREVFDAGPDATALEALNERRTEYPGHVRILGEVLEVAAAQR